MNFDPKKLKPVSPCHTLPTTAIVDREVHISEVPGAMAMADAVKEVT
jgi:hypothetical protein